MRGIKEALVTRDRRIRLSGLRLAVLAALATAALVVAIGSASAATGGCLVVNLSGVGGSWSTLQAAQNAASAGDTLGVKGTCVGSTTISKNLTITGASTLGRATLDGNNAGSVLTVNSGVVTLNGLTITNGNGGAGGGIFNNGGALIVNNSSVNGNAGANTGGIFNLGTLTLNNSNVNGNTGLYTGGIVNPNGTLTLNNSTVTGNTSTETFDNGDAGGINNGGTLTVKNSVVEGNTARGRGGAGGILTYGMLTVEDSSVKGNAGGNGDAGGIRESSFYGPQGVTLINSSVSGNTTTGRGGGIYNDSGNTLTLNNSTVTGNSAVSGGGIYNLGTLIGAVAGANVFGNTPDQIAP
jgi:hypothetical protein